MNALKDLITEHSVGLVQAFIARRCDITLPPDDIREALEVYLVALLAEVKTLYGITDVGVEPAKHKPGYELRVPGYTHLDHLVLPQAADEV